MLDGFNTALFVPMLAQALMVLALAFFMGAARFVSVQAGKVKGRDVAAGVWPGRLGVLSNSYNNQFQMPQIFYVVCIALTLMGAVSPMTIKLAWAFVISRLIHLIWHNTKNIIIIRFLIFVVSGIILLCMTIIALQTALS